MRQLVVGFCCVAALSCATAEHDTHGSPPATEKGPGEGDCLRSIALAKKHHCDDRPADIAEGYATRARERYDELDRQCPGTRSRHALRALDECIWTYESEPGQTESEAKARRETAHHAATILKSEPVFMRLVQKKRAAADEADNAAEDYKTARANNADANEIRFRKEAWDASEQTVKKAESELRGAMKQADVDPRDARFFGFW
jgi:hypothetical protein